MNVENDTDRINKLLNLYGYNLTDFYEVAEQIPDASGVYFLWSDEALEYIGQSANIRKRLSNGHPVYNPQDICLIGIIDLPDSTTITAIEIALIKLLKPRQNSAWRLQSPGAPPKDSKVVQRNIGMYPEDWAKVDTLARVMRVSLSAAMRFIIKCWRDRDIGDPQIRELVKQPAEETVPS